MCFEITENTKRYLLHQARRAIYSSLGCELPEETSAYSEDEIQEKAGAFVTLRIKGNLRGCVGMLANDEPLINTVIKMAKSAAFNDSRFSPVTKEELDNIHVEITVLSPMVPVEPQEVKVGTDGLFMEFMGRHGVLLPQVPVEYGWNRTEFLNHLCLKAGLPADTWKNYKISLYKFNGIIFGEDD